MLRIVESLIRDHDLGLVALACLVCVLAAHTTVRLLGSSHDGRPRLNAVRTGAAIVAFSTGVWTTHFIGMLAFHLDLPVNFDVPLCILSLVFAIVGTTVAFAIRPHRSEARGLIVTSGFILAGGI